ncbi:hypothetical protein NDU88_003715 [Pleurodeles waltl]|uniref:Uncharacterized protein n=1 Tax=Pleurodeles waltl TaxID=8319 RepID=A0AAV7V1G4_PLEWA|nr:hypothetical protein NDU88_003715 [Pleurodeles waltl]
MGCAPPGNAPGGTCLSFAPGSSLEPDRSREPGSQARDRRPPFMAPFRGLHSSFPATEHMKAVGFNTFSSCFH